MQRFKLVNLHLKQHVTAEKLQTSVSFHDRDFKYVALEEATSGQYPISSLHSDKGWWTTRLSASLFLPPPMMGRVIYQAQPPSRRQHQWAQSSVVAREKGGGQRSKLQDYFSINKPLEISDGFLKSPLVSMKGKQTINKKDLNGLKWWGVFLWCLYFSVMSHHTERSVGPFQDPSPFCHFPPGCK